MALLGCRFDGVKEVRLSHFVRIEKVFQKAARSCLKVFAVKPNFPPPFSLLGFEPAKYDSAPTSPQGVYI